MICIFCSKSFYNDFLFLKRENTSRGEIKEPAEANNFLLASLKFETVISLPFQRIIKIG